MEYLTLKAMENMLWGGKHQECPKIWTKNSPVKTKYIWCHKIVTMHGTFMKLQIIQHIWSVWYVLLKWQKADKSS
jgi:hypothetical protein